MTKGDFVTMKRDKKVTARSVMILALILLFAGYIGASLVQTDFGKIEYTELYYETDAGLTQNALLLIPETATTDNPAPCIVLEHGWYNNKEMQDMNYVEYARRGYVVIAINQNSHGDSDNIGIGYEYTGGNGMYEAVKMAARLPYVDSTRIGVAGHSFGAEACQYSIFEDGEANLIAASLMVCADPIYTVNAIYSAGAPRTIYDSLSDADGFYNLFGSRDAAVVACQYDEFYHGYTTGEAISGGVGYTAPRDYITTPNAQSFLHFGVDPTGLETRQQNVFYTQEVDGEEAIRAILTPAITHPEATMNSQVCQFSLAFFEQALGAPNPIAADNQVWQWKAVFNALSLFSLLAFLGSFALVLLDAPYFASLKAKQTVAPLPAPAGKGKLWYWGSIVLAALFSGLTFMRMFDPLEAKYTNLYNYVYDGNAPFWKQWPVTFIGVWSVVCALFLLVMLVLNYCLQGKKNGFSLVQRGVSISAGAIWKTIVLGVTVVTSAFLLVFVGDWLFETDCRIWVVAVRAFQSDKLVEVAKYLPFFLVYYLIMSVSVNAFNYVENGKPWVNMLVQCISVVLGPVLFWLVQYGVFHSTGYLFTELLGQGAGSVILGIWVYPLLVWLPTAVILTRAIYKKTNNPYIGGLIMALFVTVVSCTNTITFI